MKESLLPAEDFLIQSLHPHVSATWYDPLSGRQQDEFGPSWHFKTSSRTDPCQRSPQVTSRQNKVCG